LVYVSIEPGTFAYPLRGGSRPLPAFCSRLLQLGAAFNKQILFFFIATVFFRKLMIPCRQIDRLFKAFSPCPWRSPPREEGSQG